MLWTVVAAITTSYMQSVTNNLCQLLVWRPICFAHQDQRSLKSGCVMCFNIICIIMLPLLHIVLRLQTIIVVYPVWATGRTCSLEDSASATSNFEECNFHTSGSMHFTLSWLAVCILWDRRRDAVCLHLSRHCCFQQLVAVCLLLYCWLSAHLPACIP